jgi:hypothetical protein
MQENLLQEFSGQIYQIINQWFATKRLKHMAEYGEWNQKGATLSDVTAKKEYGVDRDFIVKGIEAGRLEYRDGAIWGNPYIRILRSQLEKYIAANLGNNYLAKVKNEAELRKTKREISSLSKKLKELQFRKTEIEKALGK